MSSLNAQQIAAAHALQGPVTISAGAGSGKTRTLTTRFVTALGSVEGERWEPASVDQILTITYTEKAAGEIADRIRRELRSAGRLDDALAMDGAWLGTIHAFCRRVLRANVLESGLEPDFGVVDEIDSRRLSDEAFEAAARGLMEGGRKILLGGYSYEALNSSVRRVASKLAASGLDPNQVQLEPARPTAELIRRACVIFSEAAASVLGCGDKRSSACDFVAACKRASEELQAGSRLDEADVAAHAWRALAPLKFGREVSTYNEVWQRVVAEHSRLLSECAVAAVHPYLEEFRTLLSDYAVRYEALKRERGVLDFDDLQAHTRRLLASDGSIRKAVREHFRLVMVDEFQDTDALQLDIVRDVAGDNLCTVGDEQQAIYGFRGADVEVYRRHEADMAQRGARRYELAFNYRSHPDVIAFVNTVCSAPSLLGETLLPLVADRDEPSTPLLPAGTPRVEIMITRKASSSSELSNRKAEARGIAARFAELHREHHVDPGDMVVLVRTYTHAHVYADALAEAGLDSKVVGGRRFYGLPEVAMMRAFVRVLANPSDDEALVALLASDLVGLSDDGLLALRRGFDHEEGSPEAYRALARAAEALSGDDLEAAQCAKATIDSARMHVGRRPLAEIILRAVEASGLDLELLAQGGQGRRTFANILKFARMATEFENAGGAGPAAFASHLDALDLLGDRQSAAPVGDERTGSVRIMSIHASKGLEFPVVAIPGLHAPAQSDREPVRCDIRGQEALLAMRLPGDWDGSKGSGHTKLFAEMLAASRQADVEESARLFYVGCTRAEDMLVLTGTANLEAGPKADGTSLMDRLQAAIPESFAEAAVRSDAIVEVGGARVRMVVSDSAQAATGEAVAPATAPPARRRCIDDRAPKTGAAGPPARLSYSQLARYKDCPKRFWAESVLRMGTLRLRAESPALALGSAVHLALELADGVRPPSSQRMDIIATQFELDQKARADMREAVDRYLGSDVAREISACESVRREFPFALDVGDDEEAFLLVGGIDAYGRSGDQARIVDYKTGTAGVPAELDTRYRLQASVYALVSLRDGCTHARVIFVRPQVDDDGGLQRFCYEFDQEDVALIEGELLAMRRKMLGGEFESRDRRDAHICGDCPVSGICPTPT